MSCKACAMPEDDESTERKERILHFVFLGVGLALLVIALVLNKVDSSAFSELEWDSFSNPSFFSSLSFYSFLFYTVDYAFLSYILIKNMVEEIKEKNYINEFTLMFLATVGAYAIGEFLEAVLVILFNIVGETLEDYATEKSKKSIQGLVNDIPLFAHVVKEDGSIVDENPEHVPVGTLLEIRPGEKVSIDGVLVQGHSSLDMSSINGESLPKDVKEGDMVYSGSINLSSVLILKTRKRYWDSTLSRILSLVENEQEKKAKSEKFITRFSKIYTPIVVLIALFVFLLGYGLSGFVWEGTKGGEVWLYRSLSILLISCPCALVISVPISFFAGIGVASKLGILIKGSLPLENLSKAQVFFFDKTGTLTKGDFVLQNKVEERNLQIAASLESKSTHPLAKAITSAYQGDLLPVVDFRNVPGGGIEGTIDNRPYLLGSKAFLLHNEVQDFPETDTPYKVLYLAEEGKEKIQDFIVADEIKEGAKEAIKGLREQKVEKTIMLSGDDRRIAHAVQEEIGLDGYKAELLPDEKLKELKSYMPQKKVAFVGDGINDSPSLLASDVGISMGGLGSDAAIEASDVVIMDDSLTKLAEGRRLSRRTMINVIVGVLFAILVKVLVMILVALGYGGNFAMILGTLSDTGIMALCVLHSMSLLLYKTKYIPHPKRNKV